MQHLVSLHETLKKRARLISFHRPPRVLHALFTNTSFTLCELFFLNFFCDANHLRFADIGKIAPKKRRQQGCGPLNFVYLVLRRRWTGGPGLRALSAMVSHRLATQAHDSRRTGRRRFTRDGPTGGKGSGTRTFAILLRITACPAHGIQGKEPFHQDAPTGADGGVTPATPGRSAISMSEG